MSSSTTPTQQNSNSAHNQEEDEEAFLYAMQLASASVLPMVLTSAIQLNLLELIKKAGQGAFISPTELAAQLPTNNPEAPFMLDRILRLLASYSVLECKLTTSSHGGWERVYGLGAVCKFLTKNEDGVSMAPFAVMSQDKVAIESWYHLKDAVVEGGIAFNKAHGMDVFDYFGTDERISNIFNHAMFDHSTIVMKKIIETYKGFNGLSSIVDVGGGTGASLNMIISEYPSIKGINFDLPRVIQVAPSYPGVEHVGGDMFKSVPKGDAIFMKWISHNWTDEACLKLFKNCYESLPENNGKLILCESILPEIPDTGLNSRNVFQMDVIMLAHNTGGRERTEREIQALAQAAGFQGFRKVCNAYNTWIMELLK